MTGARLRRAAVRRLLPGIGQVAAQAPEFADAWKASNRRASAMTGPLWVALGDSMSQGIGAGSIEGGWVGQLRALLESEGCPVRLVNLSVTGARTRDVLEKQLPHLGALPVAPALVTVLVGANDMFPPCRRRDAVAVYPRLLAALPAGRTVIATLPRRNRAALAVNALVDRAAEEGRVRVADMRGMTLASLIGTRAQDHFHPNEKGYADIAHRFAVAVDRCHLH